jgi:hypothetical protein
MHPITNLNSLLVKNYVPGSDTLAVIRELKNLGIIKGPKPKSKPTPKMIEDIKQESDMVGYVKTLEGQPGRQNPNIFSLRQVESGMSQQQIEDLRQRNEAGVATLRAEVRQQRLEDLEQQQGQRFADITRFGGIINPILERFRGAQDPGAGQRVEPFSQVSTIFLPDVQEETFTQSLNEGGPRAEPAIQTELFAEEEEPGNISTAPPNLQPREKVGGGRAVELEAEEQPITTPRPRQTATKMTRKEYLKSNGLDQIPQNTKSTTLQEMGEYYRDFCSALGYDVKPEITNNKSEMYKEMVSIVNDEISSINL